MKDKMECSLTETLCEHCVNKRYNYGFVSGTASYCKIEKRFTANMRKCPEGKEVKNDEQQTV